MTLWMCGPCKNELAPFLRASTVCARRAVGGRAARHASALIPVVQDSHQQLNFWYSIASCDGVRFCDGCRYVLAVHTCLCALSVLDASALHVTRKAQHVFMM